MPNADSPRVAIIGGGITGLSAAWELQKAGVDYTLFEASDRLGGKIVTEHIDGFTIEAGADSFLTSKRAAWDLCREIGFTDRLIGTNQIYRNVFVWQAGKLHPFPRGMRLIVPVDPAGLLESDLLSDAGKQRMLDEVNIPPRHDVSDESLASFIRRRFGQEALEVFGESLLSGIHVADPEALSINSTFPQYAQFERDYGSVTLGARQMIPPPLDPDMPPSTFVSPIGGMAELIDALRSALTGELRLQTHVATIAPDQRLTVNNREHFHADGVIITTPAVAACALLSEVAPYPAQMMGTLHAISSATVSIGFRADQIDHPLNGYGFVIPRREGTRITACTWSSTKLAGRAPDGYVLIRVFFGGFGREPDVSLADDTLIDLARRELVTMMNIHADPVISRVFRWQRASPQYEVGHGERMRALTLPDWIKLAGCWQDGVGIPDCVRQGRSAARALIEGFHD